MEQLARQFGVSLNPELRDLIYPLFGASVHEQWFMEPTLERLMACSTPIGDFWAQRKHRSQCPPMQVLSLPTAPNFVDFEDNNNDEPQGPLAQPKKRSHAHMEDGSRVFHSI